MVRRSAKLQEYLFEKPVAVLGCGASGIAAKNLLEKEGHPVVLYDQESKDLNVLNEFYEIHALRHNLVIYSPGFSPRHPWIKCARKYCDRVLGELDFASYFWKGDILAVTGTNGKTTVCQFLSMLLQKKGISVTLCGNIGIPLSQRVVDQNSENSLAVCEVSSFQAQRMEYFQPSIIIWTNFSEDHLDYHKDMAEYFQAKWDLVDRLHPEGILLAGVSVRIAAEMYGKKLPDKTFIVDRRKEKFSSIPEKSPFQLLPQQENYWLVKKYADLSGISQIAVSNTAMVFTLAKHRLEMTGTYQGVEFWNDSKATNYDAAIQAIHSFKKPVIWIGGGKDKGIEFDGFVKKIKKWIQSAYLIGEVQHRLNQLLLNQQIRSIACNDLNDAVQTAFAEASAGDVILFSPGFSSFDMYVNYEHRGNSFKNAFLSLKNVSNPSNLNTN